MQVVLARRVIGKADEFRLAFLGDLDVVERIGAAHVECGRRAVGAHHAEAGEEFLHEIEIRRPQPPIGNVGRFDPGHAARLLRECSAEFCTNLRSRHQQDQARATCSVIGRDSGTRCGPASSYALPLRERVPSERSERGRVRVFFARLVRTGPLIRLACLRRAAGVYPKFNSLKKSLPLSSMTMKAGKFSTSMRQIASMPSSGYSTVSTFLMWCSARLAAAPPIEAR